MAHAARQAFWATCECGKRSFRTRGEAKAVAKRAHPSERLSVYRCGDGYHYGHLPANVRAGRVTRELLYG